MTDLLLMLAMLICSTSNVTFTPYDGPDITAEYNARYHTNAEVVGGWALCTPEGCEIVLPAKTLRRAVELYHHWLETGEEPDPRRFARADAPFRALIHELLHVYDYQDDGRFNGSPWGRRPAGVPADPYAHWYVDAALESRCLTPDLCAGGQP